MLYSKGVHLLLLLNNEKCENKTTENSSKIEDISIGFLLHFQDSKITVCYF